MIHFQRAFFLRGARDAILLPAWIVAFAMLGIGSLAREIGFPFWGAVLSTPLIWAAPAQIIFFGGLAGGTALPLLAVAIGLSSIRFLPMTMTFLPLIRRPGQSVLLQLVCAHYVAVTVWIESLRRLPHIDPDSRIAYYLGFANACMLVSTVMTGVGYYISAALPGLLTAGLLFIPPVYFAMAMVAGARGPGEWTAIALGVALAPLFGWLAGPDIDLLLTGLIGGSVAYLIGRVRR